MPQKLKVGASREFLDKIGLGEGLIDLPTDELFMRAERANPDPAMASHEVGRPKSYSTARSFSVGMDGSERLMPQVVEGFLLTPKDAINWSLLTGKHFGTYADIPRAERAGRRLHDLQELHGDLLRTGRRPRARP